MTTSSPVSPAVRALAAILAVHGAVVALATVWLVVEVVVARPADAVSAGVLTLLTLTAAAAFGLTASGVLRRRRWSRSPGLVLEVFVAIAAVSMVQGTRWYVGLPLLLSALAAVGLSLSRPVALALSDAATSTPAAVGTNSEAQQRPSRGKRSRGAGRPSSSGRRPRR
ncbi:MAG: hypothetical protein M3Q27_12235 [Actinomycetota bacterium]|nr:hypothetical protein [Actinomycetota bacterium]